MVMYHLSNYQCQDMGHWSHEAADMIHHSFYDACFLSLTELPLDFGVVCFRRPLQNVVLTLHR